MTALSTFAVADVITKLADKLDYNVEIDGIDDNCYGLLISADKSFVSFLSQHSGPLNFQVLDGDPIRIVRRAVDSDLVIDLEIAEADCISRNGAPAIQFQRDDQVMIPRQVEIQYYDPDRQFAITSQFARDPGQPATNSWLSATLDFVLSADQARQIAFDWLFRMKQQQLTLAFEHNDIRIEPGDVLRITADQGIYTVLVTQATITKARTVMVSAVALLTSRGNAVTGGTASPTVNPNTADDYVAWFVSSM